MSSRPVREFLGPREREKKGGYKIGEDATEKNGTKKSSPGRRDGTEHSKMGEKSIG